jgi:hypothetical protein
VVLLPNSRRLEGFLERAIAARQCCTQWVF